ncbi:uncharacterized protein PGTG_11990 [Puccinia graminis f. sp. tritici CRL 75-36-700-3]|uniref:Uncharacterized protein n=1 Tax=Puccinia graminis f. sp. tritici (strain CRL 75-36-700-3 / race SCCL) TaxID=418459 RepID=E3KP09_PUCGT|nr:uncharacterized protein PGTG_11990 [Puccinia graminis f. sp. tritici CRL 75-36-700-3]EFP86034.2 hypothetical protein PGTG_11990 [Puccinia graminis f. sp. tritici CRL 75-36-700-3]
MPLMMRSKNPNFANADSAGKLSKSTDGRSSQSDEDEREIEPPLELVPGKLGKYLIHESMGKKINMQNTDSLKPHEKEELEVVTKHLQQLQNYLKLPIGKSSEDEIGKLESLVEPLFQKENHSSHHGSWRNPMSMVKGATRKLSSKRQDGAVSGTGINEIMKTDLIPLWRDLQAKFIKIKCRDPKEDSALKLKFLRSLLVLGDYIHKNELLPQREIKKIKIFEPTTAIKLFQFHTELLIFSEGKDLFGSPEWVTPQMDLLLSNPSFGPFHRSLADSEKHNIKSRISGARRQ